MNKDHTTIKLGLKMLDEVFMYVAISMYACTVIEYMTKQTKHLAICTYVGISNV